MYSSVDSGGPQPSGLKRLARRDLPGTPRTPRVVAAPAATPVAEDNSAIVWPVVSLGSAIGWLLKGAKWIVVLAILGAIGGYGFTMVAKPKYTAYADLVVDPGNLQVVGNDLTPAIGGQNGQLLDVESKLRVLTSGNVLTRVVTDLKLQDDPEFVPPPSAFNLSFLTGGSEISADPVMTAMGMLGRKVTARREERSYMVTVAVSTESPPKSVLIADALVAAFQAELAKADSDSATRAAASLLDRLSELRAGVTAAEDKVADFQRENGLEQSNGESVNAQSMTLLNQRLIDAQQALIGVEARYEELRNGRAGRLNADTIQTPTMVALRTQYGQLRQEADAAAALYGPRHPNRGTAERQLAGLQVQIDAEAARYVQAASLDLEQARRTVTELETQAAAARSTVASDGTALVQLRDLERDARSKSEVYETYLNRSREIVERQQLDTTNVRVISPATPPGSRSFPPRGYVMAGLGAFGGIGLGVALALGLGFLAAFRRLRKA